MGRILPYMKWNIKFMFETTNQYIFGSSQLPQSQSPLESSSQSVHRCSAAQIGPEAMMRARGLLQGWASLEKSLLKHPKTILLYNILYPSYEISLSTP